MTKIADFLRNYCCSNAHPSIISAGWLGLRPGENPNQRCENGDVAFRSITISMTVSPALSAACRVAACHGRPKTRIKGVDKRSGRDSPDGALEGLPFVNRAWKASTEPCEVHSRTRTDHGLPMLSPGRAAHAIRMGTALCKGSISRSDLYGDLDGPTSGSG